MSEFRRVILLHISEAEFSIESGRQGYSSGGKKFNAFIQIKLNDKTYRTEAVKPGADGAHRYGASFHIDNAVEAIREGGYAS